VGQAQGAGKRATPQAGNEPDDNARPYDSARRSSGKKDDSDDDNPGPGGSGGARQTRSNTAARKRTRAKSRAATSGARFEASDASTSGSLTESTAEEAVANKVAETNAIDAWADEIVRSSHGAKAAKVRPAASAEAEDDSSAREESGARKESQATEQSEADDPEVRDVHPGGISAGQDDEVPGPLTLAASAARIEAEARIRAAMMQARHDAQQVQSELTQSQLTQSELTQSELTQSELTQSNPAASWAHARPSERSLETSGEDQPEIALAWGGPAFTMQQAYDSGDSGVVSPRPTFEAFDDVDAADDSDTDDDPDAAAEDRPERSLSGYVRRSRIARGYSIPRLSRSKRPGAVPGL